MIKKIRADNINRKKKSRTNPRNNSVKVHKKSFLTVNNQLQYKYTTFIAYIQGFSVKQLLTLNLPFFQFRCSIKNHFNRKNIVISSVSFRNNLSFILRFQSCYCKGFTIMDKRFSIRRFFKT